jgi:peptide/nickel transport system substrate-binding protein
MKKTTQLWPVAAPVLVLALAVAGCSGNADDAGPAGTEQTQGNTGSGTVEGSVLTVNWGGFSENWTPGAEMEAGDMRVPYENLVALVDGEIEPVLATEWAQTDEELTLTLREGVTFHDGTPFDAEAVKVNVETIQDTPGPYSGPFQVIESIDVVDNLTVRFNLSQPVPSLLTTLSTRAAPMGSPAAIEDGSIAQAPVGTGPWAYDADASVPGTRMSFGLFEDYWGEEVGYETINIVAITEDNAATAALSSGEIDLTDTETTQFSQSESAGNLEWTSYPAIRNNVMFFDRGPGGMFEDVEVRQAACYAIDTEVLAEIETDWTVKTQHFDEGGPGSQPRDPGISPRSRTGTGAL